MARREFFRSTAATKTEKYLHGLSRRTFLSLWSYANVHRDQFSHSRSSYGKEICDLLVIVGNEVIIFSDKECAFPGSGNIFLDWNRWFRRAIRKSADQLVGAERWLREHPNRVFLDPECQIRLPVKLTAQACFHRIIVAHGGAERNRRFFGGGSGSLLVAPSLVGDEHLIDLQHPQLPEPPDSVEDLNIFEFALNGITPPFSVGFVHSPDLYIHVLDTTSLNIILSHLDTAPDLIRYLHSKEEFVESGKLVSATGEEDLLGYYLGRVDASRQHAFVIPEDVAGVQIDEGHWERFISSPEYAAQQRADRISYIWDALIEHFIEHFRKGDQGYASHPAFEDQEPVFRLFALENRIQRRALARALMGFIEKAADGRRAARVHLSESPEQPVYVFMVLPIPQSVTPERYAEIRRELLARYCLVARRRFPSFRHFIGIGMPPKGVSPRSEDLVYLDASKFDEELEAEAKQAEEELALLRELRVFRYTEREYPVEEAAPSSADVWERTGRNEACPCGSGRKYKHCCWLDRHGG